MLMTECIKQVKQVKLSILLGWKLTKTRMLSLDCFHTPNTYKWRIHGILYGQRCASKGRIFRFVWNRNDSTEYHTPFSPAPVIRKSGIHFSLYYLFQCSSYMYHIASSLLWFVLPWWIRIWSIFYSFVKFLFKLFNFFLLVYLFNIDFKSSL